MLRRQLKGLAWNFVKVREHCAQQIAVGSVNLVKGPSCYNTHAIFPTFPTSLVLGCYTAPSHRTLFNNTNKVCLSTLHTVSRQLTRGRPGKHLSLRLSEIHIVKRHFRRKWPFDQGYEHFERRRGFQPGYEGWLKIAVVGAGLWGIVWYKTRQEVPYTHRWHSIVTPASTEQSLGEQYFAVLKSEAERDGSLLPPNHPAVRKVAAVGSRIAHEAATSEGGGFTEHMKGLSWEFAVIQSDSPNAFVLPGGKVVVFTALLKMLDNEDELAAVMAHEAAHVVARHVGERITRMQVLQLLQIFLYWVVGIPVPDAALVLALVLPHSRMQETEADTIGLQLAARACFDPAAATAVFTKLGAHDKAMGTDKIPGFLLTHPLSSKRVANVKQQLPEARARYENANCGAIVDDFSRAF